MEPLGRLKFGGPWASEIQLQVHGFLTWGGSETENHAAYKAHLKHCNLYGFGLRL